MMKNTFNAMLKNRPKGQKVNEIYLFRLMATAPCVVRELFFIIHQDYLTVTVMYLFTVL